MSAPTKTAPAPAQAKAEVKPPVKATTAEVKKAAGVYTPAGDSTPDQKKRSEDTGQVVLDLSGGACLCGCKGESASRFQPGHDARLKGKLVRAQVAGVGMLILMDGQEQEVSPRQFAKAMSGKYDWVKGLDESVARLKEQAAADSARKAESEKKAAERRAAAAEKGKGKISLADFATK